MGNSTARRRYGTIGCAVEECARPHDSHGYCVNHARKWKKYGDPRGADPMRKLTPEERYWAKVDKRGPDECWPWIGCIDSTGYGAFRWNGNKAGAHRIAYFFTHGHFPGGSLDHLCRVRHCVNPAHLEPVTIAENTRRGYAVHGPTGAAAIHAAKTHCSYGHLLPPREPGAKQRVCSECKRRIKREWARQHRARRRLAREDAA